MEAGFVFLRLAMGKPPSFPMYASDFDMDTNTWTNEEVGVYLRLLLSEWVNQDLPDDSKKLAKIVRISHKKFQKVFTNISHKFHKNGNNRLVNRRLEEERQKKLNWLENQSKSGKKGADIRWKNG